MSDLKPCPCCNGISWVYYRAFTTYVYCDKCGLRTKDYGTEAEAIEAWNTRHERTLSEKDALAVVCEHICGDGYDAEGRAKSIIHELAKMCGAEVVRE